ncbi:MAG: SprT family zinc-dependent metalloprotease [Clostridia bacterium]|nr:SprT family zinc-dependent metalloprotease [Clostridia bacterium]MDD4387043.1 SprT family zinc-dependent metalloprotease [Clostridia bacterium]
MAKEIICIDNIVIEVKRKKIKNINLKVNKDKSITISANSKISIDKLKELVNFKKNWIYKNLNKIDIYHTKHELQEYINGEEIKIQGMQYKLLVLENDKNKVEIEENVIYLYTSDISNYKKKKSIIDKFINNKAIELFEESLDSMLNIIRQYGVNKPDMKIRKMKSRWGSCNRAKKKITINYELVKAPKNCLEYVILHELIHFLVLGHNKIFYKYMTVLMPDWKVRKKILSEQYLL